MDTSTSILITQTPIAIACLWLAYEVRKARKTLEKLSKKKRK